MSTRRALLEGMLASTALAMLPGTGFAATAPRQPLSRGYDPTLFHHAMTADPGPIDLTLSTADIRGRIPDVLRGWTYLSNGPSRLDWDGKTVHPFDGHGYLRAFHFDADGQVKFRARYIQTPAFQAEDASQTLVYRGLGTLAASPGERGWRRTNRKTPGRRNVANTTIYTWGDTLLAGWEGGLPYAVDPHTLETHGPDRFGDALGENEAFLAHVRFDHSKNRLVGVSPKMGPKTTLTFREFDEQKSLVSQREVTLPWPLMIHDFVITENYYGLVSNTLKLKMGTLLRTIGGADSLINAIDFNREEEGELVLIPRTEGPVRRIPLGQPAFVIHYANAFEEGDDVVVDACLFDDTRFGQEFGFLGQDRPLDPTQMDFPAYQRLIRIRANLATQRASLTDFENRTVDFPRIHPHRDGLPYDRLFAATRSDTDTAYPFDAVAGIDPSDPERPMDLWVSGGSRFVGEPVFVPAPGETTTAGGAVIVPIYDGPENHTRLCVFDPQAISAGPLAEAALPFMLPFGFHGGMTQVPLV